MNESEWKDIALWLADCEAATAYHYATTKSSSKSEVRRHATICERLAQMISVGVFFGNPSKQDAVINRLHGAVEECDRSAPRKR